MKLVTLVGSSKQEADFHRWNKELTLKGYCVLSLGIFVGKEREDYNEPTALKQMLKAIHRKKIELADIVAVITKPNGSLGSHTVEEIRFAHSLGKEVLYVQQLPDISEK